MSACSVVLLVSFVEDVLTGQLLIVLELMVYE